MDDIVAQAMARWPDVPAVYGWLRLDRRGRWLVKGEPIGHRPTIEFINRNYLRDDRGRYFFQNGPQRVFVDLDHCPFVLSTGPVIPSAGTAALVTHTGALVTAPRHAWIDSRDGVTIEFELGIGSVVDRDLPVLVECFRDAAGRPLDAEGWDQALAGGASGLTLVLSTGPVPVSRLTVDSPRGRATGQTGAPHMAGGVDFVRAPRPDPGEDACI
jgi:hypothetical protein